MALVTVVGYPCSGKSTRANELKRFLTDKLALPSTPSHLARLKVVIINDETLGISKSAYDDSRAEKPARATLFSAVTRAINSETIVIADAMNYIKGSRYQMYCQAREIGIRTCTLFVAAPADKCKSWNSQTSPDRAYSEATLDNLISRFEEPNSAARWDAPLITVPFFDPSLCQRPETQSDGTADDDVVGSADAERIWEAITTGDVKPPNVAVLPVLTSTTSYLTLLESVTASVVATLLAQQALSPLSGTTTLVLPAAPPAQPTPIRLELTVNRTVSMPMLQRIKRQYTKLNQQARTELSSEQVARLFGQYLENNL